MRTAAPYQPASPFPDHLAGNFSDTEDQWSTETAAYLMEKAKTLLRQEKFEEAFKTLEKCAENHPNMPDRQFLSLRELTAKAISKANTLLSDEELKRWSQRLSSSGLSPTTIAAKEPQEPIAAKAKLFLH